MDLEDQLNKLVKAADKYKLIKYELIKASKEGDLKRIKFLVNQGANTRVLNDLALRWASRRGRLEVVKYLVEQGADIHADDSYPLRWASRRGRLEVVKYLVEQGADIHAEDDYAIRWASVYGYLDVVKYLLSLEPKLYWLTHQDQYIRGLYKRYGNI